MKKCLLALLGLICFVPIFSQGLFTGSLKETDPSFDRPDEGMPPTTISTIGTNVFYNLITVDVPATSLVTFSSNSIWDNFMILYGPGGFNPALPLTNALLANDDFSGPNSGFTYNFTAPGTYYLVICSFKNNVTGSYTITTTPALVLPLKLLSFVAGKTGNNNIIKWSSADERDLSAYQVQRSITNNNFNDLKNGNVAAKNSTTGTAYTFLDINPAPGNNYYRLKITERSGHISYSPVALVKNGKTGITSLHIFPNPSSDYVQLEAKSLQHTRAFVAVINSAGVTIQSGQYLFNDQAILSVDIRKLPAGKYFLKTIIDKEVSSVVFIKSR